MIKEEGKNGKGRSKEVRMGKKKEGGNRSYRGAAKRGRGRKRNEPMGGVEGAWMGPAPIAGLGPRNMGSGPCPSSFTSGISSAITDGSALTVSTRRPTDVVNYAHAHYRRFTSSTKISSLSFTVTLKLSILSTPTRCRSNITANRESVTFLSFSHWSAHICSLLSSSFRLSSFFSIWSTTSF